MAMDLVELATTGSVTLATHRVVHLEINAMIGSGVTVWYLGWRG